MTTIISGTDGVDKVKDGTIQTTDFAAGVPARSNLPAGTVLQVVQGTSTATPAISSTSFVTASLSATITPTSATSKILVFYSSAVYLSASGVSAMSTIYRNASNLGGSNGLMQTYSNSGGVAWTNHSFSYLDSPATTSATTYTIYARVTTGSCQFGNDPAGNVQSTITLIEVAV